MIGSNGEVDYSTFEIEFGDQKNYEIIGKLGRGKYSEVFEGVDIRNGNRVCLKILKPVLDKKIKREVKILSMVSGGPNIIKLVDVVEDPKSRVPSIVTEFVEGNHIGEYASSFTPHQIMSLSYEIVVALSYSHSKGIMHRDINKDQKLLRIIDWGLAEFHRPGAEYNCRVASRYYKAPELLCGNKKYDYRVDMWGFACILAAMVFRRFPFFQGRDNNDQLVKIARRLGTKRLYEYVEKYDLQLDSHFDGLLTRNRYKRKDLRTFKNEENAKNVGEEVIDLLGKLFVYDHEKRLKAEEVMLHPYFDPLRKKD